MTINRHGVAVHSRRARDIVDPVALTAAVTGLTADDLNVGMHWHAERRYELIDLAGDSGLEWERLAWAAAALSPGLSWPGTMEGLSLLLTALVAGQGMPRGTGHLTFGYRGRERAWAILTTDVDPATVARGPKVEALAANLLGDLDRVVVDRHVTRAATGLDLVQPSVAQYRMIANAVALQAVLRGIRPAQLQAALWHARQGHWSTRRRIQAEVAS